MGTSRSRILSEHHGDESSVETLNQNFQKSMCRLASWGEWIGISGVRFQPGDAEDAKSLAPARWGLDFWGDWHGWGTRAIRNWGRELPNPSPRENEMRKHGCEVDRSTCASPYLP